MSRAKPRIQIVLANYHCREEIQGCLAGLAKAPDDVAIEVAVVENGGPPVPHDFPGRPPALPIAAIVPPANVGYFGALRLAVDRSASDARYDFRILCNPDIRFAEPDCLSRLVRLPLPDRTGIVAPRILSGTSGRDQNPYLRDRPSALLRARWRAVYSSYPAYVLNGWLSRLAATRPPPDRPAERPSQGLVPIYAPHGSFLVLTEGLVADLPPAGIVPFLFGEELFLGEICFRRGWRVVYAPEVGVRHEEHATTAALPPRRRFALQGEAFRAFLRLLEEPGTP